jgi:hypothetical protein
MITRPASSVVTMTMAMRMDTSGRVWDQQS